MNHSSRPKEAVIIPSNYDPGCYSCVRSLSKRGITTIVASEYENVPAAGSRYCDGFVRVPSPTDDVIAYKDALKGIAARQDVRTILPLRPFDSYVFSKYYDEFDQYVTLIAPPYETLLGVYDRVQLYRTADEAGVSVPATKPFDDFNGWGSELIIKSRYNLLAKEYMSVYSGSKPDVKKEVKYVSPRSIPDRDTIVAEMEHVPIVQDYVRYDSQYVFGALYDRGDPVATFQHEQIRGDSYTGGGGVYRKSFYDPSLERAGRTLLASLDWHGLACVEFAKDVETGEYMLLEVNPRLWQSLPCAVRAGADFPSYYWDLATGRGESINPRYRTGVGSHFVYGELQHLLSVLRDDSSLIERPSLVGTGVEILASCLAEPVFDEFRIDDPMPFVRGVLHVLAKRD